ARYDLVNDLLTGGLDRGWRRAVVAAVTPEPGQRILDLAAGTGTSSKPFADAGALVVAADLSLGMLQVGAERQPQLTFVNADALALPFADAAFDAVTISFGLRNVEDTDAALAELRRVTRPGGRIVICEFSTPTFAPLRWLYQNVALRALPLIARLSASNPIAYEYLAES
ncbi:MAG: ubiquinone/menaquinone biosynthesis methyltransferase, partial [Actinobacteria bacterium]|nr:ubiquinone/menaquinone biosynthesis methyltransferase [Actinomycetota bacterium]